jgi:flagellar biosynthetic protein FliQ
VAITPEFVVGFAREAMELTLIISLPMMGVGLAVGVALSIFQAATQIQDATLSLVPKLIAMFVALILAFPWIMDKMMTYTTNLLTNLPNYIR